MSISSSPYGVNFPGLTPNAWTQVGVNAPAGKHRCVSITVNTGLADVVSVHIGTASPGAGKPSLWNAVSLDDGGGKSSVPHMVTSGEGVWVKSVLGYVSGRIEGFEEDN